MSRRNSSVDEAIAVVCEIEWGEVIAASYYRLAKSGSATSELRSTSIARMVIFLQPNISWKEDL